METRISTDRTLNSERLLCTSVELKEHQNQHVIEASSSNYGRFLLWASIFATNLRFENSKFVEVSYRTVLKDAGILLARRLVWTMAVGLDVLDPVDIALDPEEVLNRKSMSERERAAAVRRLLQQDRKNDYQRVLILHSLGYVIDPAEYRKQLEDGVVAQVLRLSPFTTLAEKARARVQGTVGMLRTMVLRVREVLRQTRARVPRGVDEARERRLSPSPSQVNSAIWASLKRAAVASSTPKRMAEPSHGQRPRGFLWGQRAAQDGLTFPLENCRIRSGVRFFMRSFRSLLLHTFTLVILCNEARADPGSADHRINIPEREAQKPAEKGPSQPAPSKPQDQPVLAPAPGGPAKAILALRVSDPALATRSTARALLRYLFY